MFSDISVFGEPDLAIGIYLVEPLLDLVCLRSVLVGQKQVVWQIVSVEIVNQIPEQFRLLVPQAIVDVDHLWLSSWGLDQMVHLSLYLKSTQKVAFDFFVSW
jgi:hypothetical protein